VGHQIGVHPVDDAGINISNLEMVVPFTDEGKLNRSG